MLGDDALFNIVNVACHGDQEEIRWSSDTWIGNKAIDIMHICERSARSVNNVQSASGIWILWFIIPWWFSLQFEGALSHLMTWGIQSVIILTSTWAVCTLGPGMCHASWKLHTMTNALGSLFLPLRNLTFRLVHQRTLNLSSLLQNNFSCYCIIRNCCFTNSWR